MLGKVLKYDLKSQGKSLIPLYGALLISALICKLSDVIGEKISFMQIVYKIMIVLFVLLFIGSIFYTLFVAIKRFYKNLFADEGYLTNTLPVTKNELLVSKIISSLIYFVVTLCFMFISLIVIIGSKELFDGFDNIILSLAKLLDISKGAVILMSLILIIITYMYYIFMVFSGIAAGQSFNGNKTLFSVIFSIVLYYLGQVINTIGLGMMSLFDKDFTASLNSIVPNSSYIKQVIIFIIVVDMVTMAIYYFVMYKRFKRLNLG